MGMISEFEKGFIVACALNFVAQLFFNPRAKSNLKAWAECLGICK